MTEPTIAVSFAVALLDFAVTKGADRAKLIESAGLDPSALDGLDNRIPIASYLALLEAGREACREPAFALLFGEAVRLEEVSIVGLISASAETVGEGRLQLNRYARLMVDEGGPAPDMLELFRDADGPWLELTSSIYKRHPLLTEAAFTRCIYGVRRNLRRPSFPRAIHFTHEEPSYRGEYDRIFNVPLVFGSHKNAMLIDDEFLSIRLSRPNRYVFGVLSQRADALLEKLQAANTVRSRVESELIPILHTGELSMELIASKLGLSRQTLYRKLQAENTRYEDVLDELRRTMALHFLEGKKVSVNEAAYLVGFSDPSAFSRAFKRWTGRSPGGRSRPGQSEP